MNGKPIFAVYTVPQISNLADKIVKGPFPLVTTHVHPFYSIPRQVLELCPVFYNVTQGHTNLLIIALCH